MTRIRRKKSRSSAGNQLPILLRIPCLAKRGKRFFAGIHVPPQPPYTGRMEVLYGLHPVEEALRARPEAVDHISVAREREDRRDPRLARLLELARAAGVRVTSEPRDPVDRHVRMEMHQGVVAFLHERRLLELEDLLAAPPDASGRRFFLALDGVEDPHNLGALLRSA